MRITRICFPDGRSVPIGHKDGLTVDQFRSILANILAALQAGGLA